jgi:hypothetical protein
MATVVLKTLRYNLSVMLIYEFKLCCTVYEGVSQLVVRSQTEVRVWMYAGPPL